MQVLQEKKKNLIIKTYYKVADFPIVTHAYFEVPGAMYPSVPANEVQFDESGFNSLAVPKSDT